MIIINLFYSSSVLYMCRSLCTKAFSVCRCANIPIVVALIFCSRATSLSRASNNGVQGLWQTRSWFNSTFEWNAKSGTSVAVPEVVALNRDTYICNMVLESICIATDNACKLVINLIFNTIIYRIYIQYGYL